MNIREELRRLLRSMIRQKDLSIWLAKYGVLILVFLLIYLPVQQRLSYYTSNKNSLKGEIENIKKISEGFLNQKEIETMRERSKLFLNGLVDVGQATVLINRISEQALKSNLNIIQIYSDSPVPIKNDKGEDLELAGKKLNLLPISFRVDTDYKNLGAFFNGLNQVSKEVYMVESIRLQKTDPSSEALQCDITLSYISI